MRVKLGSIISDARGKLGGHTFYGGQPGAFMRLKNVPARRNSFNLQRANRNFVSIIRSWESLSSSQKLNWSSAAADFSKSNVFGDLYIPTGFELFRRLNGNLLGVGRPIITIAPSPGYVYPAPMTFAQFITRLQLIRVFTTGGVPSNTAWCFWCSGPTSDGKNIERQDFVFMKSSTPNGNAWTNFYSEYVSRFGLSRVGTKLFYRAAAINLKSGIRSEFTYRSQLINP